MVNPNIEAFLMMNEDGLWEVSFVSSQDVVFTLKTQRGEDKKFTNLISAHNALESVGIKKATIRVGAKIERSEMEDAFSGYENDVLCTNGKMSKRTSEWLVGF